MQLVYSYTGMASTGSVITNRGEQYTEPGDRTE
jgi:hypothetical protein